MAPPRLVELTAKLQAAVARDPDWFKSYAVNTPAGKPMLYNKKMGITEDEYQELLSLSTKLIMQKVGDAQIDFKWAASDVLTIDTHGKFPDLDGIGIDLKAATVKTSLGNLSDVKEIDNTDPSSPTGPWKGYRWKYEKANADFSDAVSAYIAFGKLTKSGKGILVYEAKVLQHSKVKLNTTIVFNYILP